MDIGIIGLGRMGGNMARRLARGGVRVVAFDRNESARVALRDVAGVTPAGSLAELVDKLPAPRVIWTMLPAGKPSAETFAALAPQMARGDVVVDGANAYYRDSMQHAATLATHGIDFVDAGVSGGVWGLEQGYALMFGGSRDAVARVAPYARILAPAPDRGWLHCGSSGAGHYAKMIHNGIEYGLMQAYAEGFALLEAKREFSLDVAAIAECWRHGSVVRSWLLDLTARFLANDATLQSVSPYVADSGEGRWTAHESIDLGVAAPVIQLALAMRFASQGHGDYAAKLLAKMREAFGGHALKEAQP
jgi:6-phosphogluconate dehydrogenase